VQNKESPENGRPWNILKALPSRDLFAFRDIPGHHKLETAAKTGPILVSEMAEP
jgi:hypothetical protein